MRPHDVPEVEFPRIVGARGLLPAPTGNRYPPGVRWRGMMSQLPPLRWAAIGLAGFAFVLLLLVQFVPFASFTETIGTVTAEADAYAWEGKFRAEGFGEDRREETSWYDNDFDDDDGIKNVRAAAPLLLAGCILALVAAFAPLRMPAVGAGAAALSAVVSAVGIYLMAKGVDRLFEDQQEWDVGFYFAIVASVLAAAAAVLGLLSRRTRRPSKF